MGDSDVRIIQKYIYAVNVRPEQNARLLADMVFHRSPEVRGWEVDTPVDAEASPH